mmetsp:Transcript_705/g.1955  ORF Transcript_705/g.1955 Transcript_705/m.1955 type:complete len:263 (-) Transcript_705:51-839(-)
MLRAVTLVLCANGCASFSMPTSSTVVQHARVTRSHVRPAAVRMEEDTEEFSDSVIAATYSLDNLVLDGPLEPLKDHVLVKLTEVDKQTRGGLFLTSQDSAKPTVGTVVACGPGKPHPHTDVVITMPLKAGDTVLFGEYVGTKVKYCMDDHVMLTLDDVLATVEGDQVKPVRDRLLLKPIAKAVETSTGIVLTSEAAKAQEVPNQGEVIAKGEGRFTASGTIDPIPVEIGEKIMFTKYGGTEIKYKEKKLLFVFAADCLAKYK